MVKCTSLVRIISTEISGRNMLSGMTCASQEMSITGRISLRVGESDTYNHKHASVFLPGSTAAKE